MRKLSPLLLLFIGGIVLTVGDIFAAQFTRSGGLVNYLAVFILYLGALMILIESYKSEDIAVASTILVILNIVILTIVGVIVFNEATNLTKISGITLGLVAVWMLQFGKTKEG